jgi:hypothetical protein
MSRSLRLALLGACLIVPTLSGSGCGNSDAPVAPKPGDPDTSPPATKASPGSTAKGFTPASRN